MQNTKFWLVFIEEYIYMNIHVNIHQGSNPKLPEISWAQKPLAGALENCSLLGNQTKPWESIL